MACWNIGTNYTAVVVFLLQTTLQVRKEEDVYTAVISWLEYAPEERAEDMVKIMEKVRLPLVQWEFLMGKVSKHKLFTNNGQCWQYLQAWSFSSFFVFGVHTYKAVFTVL